MTREETKLQITEARLLIQQAISRLVQADLDELTGELREKETELTGQLTLMSQEIGSDMQSNADTIEVALRNLANISPGMAHLCQLEKALEDFAEAHNVTLFKDR